RQGKSNGLAWIYSGLFTVELGRHVAHQESLLVLDAAIVSHKGGDTGDALADYQLVNIVGAFVGVDAFKIVHVPHDAVIVHDAVPAENVPRLAGRIERNSHVVHLQHGDV